MDIEVWTEDDHELSADAFVPFSNNATSMSCPPLVLWIVHFLAVLQRKCNLTKTAVALLLQFLKIFFTVLARIAPALSDINKHFPPTIYQMEKLLGINEEALIRYVVCSKCYSVYNYNDCITEAGSTQVARLCRFQSSNFGQPCNGTLLKRVELAKNKNVVLYPIKVYCYIPLQYYLSALLKRPGFHELCEHWKKDSSSVGLYRDVYDGKIWKEFLCFGGKSFLADPFTYGLMLNIDWFKPCKHIEYSVGAVYLTIMNLPRSVRF